MQQQQRVVGYVRVSSLGQADSGAGLAAQRAAIEAEARRRKWKLVQVFEDKGISAKAMRAQPQLQAALAVLKAHKADALVAAKLDRLSRSVLDYANLVDRAKHEGWVLILLDPSLDTSSPYSKATLNVLMSFAELERELAGQRTKEALAIKRKQGVRLGRPPVLPADVVGRIMRLRHRGHSYYRIAQLLTRQGVATGYGAAAWRYDTVQGVVERMRRGRRKAA